MNDILIDIKDLDFSYEKLLILQNVTLSIQQGEFVGIFGPNGGGKTTFLKLLMGFLKPTRGEISLFGQQPRLARKWIGYVPQAAHYDKQFPLSVLELVLMGCLAESNWYGQFSSESKTKALAALERVGLKEKQHQAFGTLSGGQAQRALIARALVSQPKLLLLDEPTANVDPDAGQEIYHLLSSLKGTMAILMVTHDLQGIINTVERLLCINRQVTLLGPAEVCQHFALGLYHPPLGL